MSSSRRTTGFRADRGVDLAASLSFTTLLTAVPLLATFALFLAHLLQAERHDDLRPRQPDPPLPHGAGHGEPEGFHRAVHDDHRDRARRAARGVAAAASSSSRGSSTRSGERRAAGSCFTGSPSTPSSSSSSGCSSARSLWACASSSASPWPTRSSPRPRPISFSRSPSSSRP